METFTFDKAAMPRVLRSGGFEGRQVEAIADAIRVGINGSVADMAEISRVNANVKAELRKLRNDLNSEVIAELLQLNASYCMQRRVIEQLQTEQVRQAIAIANLKSEIRSLRDHASGRDYRLILFWGGAFLFAHAMVIALLQMFTLG